MLVFFTNMDCYIEITIFLLNFPFPLFMASGTSSKVQVSCLTGFSFLPQQACLCIVSMPGWHPHCSTCSAGHVDL